MVERHLPKVNVASSNLVFRSINTSQSRSVFSFYKPYDTIISHHTRYGKTRIKLIAINTEQVMYITSSGHYPVPHTLHGDGRSFRCGIQRAYDFLKNAGFICAHRSCIVYGHRIVPPRHFYQEIYKCTLNQRQTRCWLRSIYAPFIFTADWLDGFAIFSDTWIVIWQKYLWLSFQRYWINSCLVK